MPLNCGVGEDSWESLGQQGDPTSHSWRKSVLNIHWKDGCWSWNSNTLATWWEELTHLKRPWFWKRLKAGGQGDDRGWDGWMASPTQWIWVWVNSRSWWWAWQPGMLQSIGSEWVRHNWVTELNWTDNKYQKMNIFISQQSNLYVHTQQKLAQHFRSIILNKIFLKVLWFGDVEVMSSAHDLVGKFPYLQFSS